MHSGHLLTTFIQFLNTLNKFKVVVSFESHEEHVNTVMNNDNIPNTKNFVKMEISEKTIRMQIDTGASCNVLPEKFVPPETCISKTD